MLSQKKYRDAEGNTYGVEKAVKTGRFIVVRINPGGHRKQAKEIEVCGRQEFVQGVLDREAAARGWKEVKA